MRFTALAEALERHVWSSQNDSLKNGIIATEGELIRQSQSNHFWSTITEDKFDELILKIAPLMRFREAIVPLGPAKFNFKDLVSEKEYVEFLLEEDVNLPVIDMVRLPDPIRKRPHYKGINW